MLNFSRNGTLASVGVSQMTMPSRYRSSFGGAGVPGAGCTGVLAAASGVTPPGVGSVTAIGLSGRAAAGCAEAAVANDVSDVNATATEALMNAQRIDACRVSKALRREQA